MSPPEGVGDGWGGGPLAVERLLKRNSCWISVRPSLEEALPAAGGASYSASVHHGGLVSGRREDTVPQRGQL